MPSPALSCTCPQPVEYTAPRGRGSCVKCGKRLDPEWVSSDATRDTFFDHLAEALFEYDKTTGRLMTTDEFDHFRTHCEQRERDGRGTFGFRYLDRDNCLEGLEEAVDACLYSYLDALRAKREGLGDEDFDAVLMVARYAYRLHHAFLRLRAKRHHAP